MSQLVVRRLDEDVKDKLKRRAVRHGRSMEEEVRNILQDAVRGDDVPRAGLGSLARRRFAGLAFEQDVLERLPRQSIELIKFEM